VAVEERASCAEVALDVLALEEAAGIAAEGHVVAVTDVPRTPQWSIALSTLFWRVACQDVKLVSVARI
jgi:hypothetical protein